MTSETPEHQILSRSFIGSGARTLSKSVKRFTPYRSAVSSRSRAVTQPVQAHTFTPSERGREGLAAKATGVDESAVMYDIVNKTWRLHRVSPLYNLSYRPSHLREYGKALALAIEAESHKGVAVAGATKTAEFTCITTLRSSSDDKNALKIVVKDETTKGKEKAPLVTAYLCCVDVNSNVSLNVAKEFVYLPLLVVKSNVFLSRVLVEFLQKRFDCVIRDLTLSTTDMHWLFAINAGFVPEKFKNKPVELLYVLGSEVAGIDKITFSIDAEHCQELVQSVCGEESENLSQSQKDRVILALEQHFQEHFRLYLNNLKLQRIATAVSVVGAEGRLKIYSAEHVLQVFSFLTTLCCEHFEKVTGIQTT